MKKIIFSAAVLLIIAGIIGILLYNKSKRESKRLKAEIQTTFPVLVAVTERQEISDTLSLIGTTVPFNEVIVAAETAGKVSGLYYDVGMRVNKGKVLVKLDDVVKLATLDNAQANY
ncbi:MAG: biotin/lipoyl-binding protein [Ignavibacteria bacterium]|nr:biotin/lipoyl-binding protein [Ignavibacteria bacterium]